MDTPTDTPTEQRPGRIDSMLRTLLPPIEFAPDRPLWERQPEEPASLFTAFAIYKLQPPDQRSIAAWLRSSAKFTPGNASNWQKRATRWRWVERAEALDRHQIQLTEQVWGERREQLRQQEWKVAAKLLERAEQMLAFPVVKTRQTDNGHTTIIEPADWKLADVPRIVEAASKIARLATELRVEPPADFERMSAEELTEFILTGAKELGFLPATE